MAPVYHEVAENTSIMIRSIVKMKMNEVFIFLVTSKLIIDTVVNVDIHQTTRELIYAI